MVIKFTVILLGLLLVSCSDNPNPIPRGTVIAAPNGGQIGFSISIYEACYDGVTYLLHDRGISPKFNKDDGKIILCKP